jgi:hypothetical protein
MRALIGRGLSELLIKSVLSCTALVAWTVFMPPPLYGQQPAAAAAAPTPSPTPAPSYPVPSEFAVDASTPSLTIQYSLGTPNANGQFPVVGEGSGTKQIQVNAGAVLGLDPATVDVTMTFLFGANKVPIPATVPGVAWQADPGAYVITQAQLDQLANTLVSTLNQLKTGFDSDTAVAIDSPVTLNVTPGPIGGFVVQKTAADNPLQIVMKQVLHKPAKPSAQASPSGQVVSTQVIIVQPQGSESAGPAPEDPAHAKPSPPKPDATVPKPPEPNPAHSDPTPKPPAH